MTDLHHAFIVGPKDGKPQKGNATWLDFVHSDEHEAEDLARRIAAKLSAETGFSILYHVEPVPSADGAEDEVLAEAERISALYR